MNKQELIDYLYDINCHADLKIEDIADELCENYVTPRISYKKNEIYQEIDIFNNNIKIGEAEVDINNKMLSRLNIYEPYKNKGYGQQIVRALIDAYNIDNLWVNADNNIAIHVYEKCGFVIKKPTMYLMEMGGKDET